MRNAILYTASLASMLWLARLDRAIAQYPNGPGGNRPAVSPYINLLRTDQSQAVNFYGLVRPQIDTRNSIQNLQQQVSLSGDTQGGAQGSEFTTGHPVRFQNLGSYFGRNLSSNQTFRNIVGAANPSGAFRSGVGGGNSGGGYVLPAARTR